MFHLAVCWMQMRSAPAAPSQIPFGELLQLSMSTDAVPFADPGQANGSHAPRACGGTASSHIIPFACPFPRLTERDGWKMRYRSCLTPFGDRRLGGDVGRHRVVQGGNFWTARHCNHDRSRIVPGRPFSSGVGVLARSDEAVDHGGCRPLHPIWR